MPPLCDCSTYALHLFPNIKKPPTVSSHCSKSSDLTEKFFLASGCFKDAAKWDTWAHINSFYQMTSLASSDSTDGDYLTATFMHASLMKQLQIPLPPLPPSSLKACEFVNPLVFECLAWLIYSLHRCPAGIDCLTSVSHVSVTSLIYCILSWHLNRSVNSTPLQSKWVYLCTVIHFRLYQIVNESSVKSCCFPTKTAEL